MTRASTSAAVLLALCAAVAGRDLGDLGDLVPGAPRSEAGRHFNLQAVPSHVRVAPGQTFHVALDVRIAEGWAYYSPDPGPTVMPARLRSVKADKFAVGDVLWPPDKPHVGDGGRVNNAYEGRAIVYVPITVPAGAGASEQQTIELVPDGQICTKGKCVRIDGLSATATVTVAEGPAPNPQWGADPAFRDGLKFARTAAELKAAHGSVPVAPAREVRGAPAVQLSLWAGLGMALLAGLILNIMPCVLPVIPLKVLSLVRAAGESRRRFVTLGLAFAGGIVLFFAGIGLLNVVLRLATASALNWGEHFQIPGFRIGMAMLVVAMAANLFGLFTVVVPARLAGTGSGGSAGAGRETRLSAAGAGVLTAILSTPCSFAILTLALAWAQLQALWLGTVAILLIGVGMSAPYAVLTAFPRLVRRLPRPGRWMELFKQSMGFLLLIVAVWLISTVTEQTYPLWVAGYGVVLAFCLWMWGAWVRYDAPAGRKVAVRATAAALAVAAGLWMLRPPRAPAVRFEPFDEARIAAARSAGQIVLVDFTASWCLTCKTVEALVYDDPGVAEELARRNVLAVKGDVTTRDLPANRMLYEDLKEPGVPVTVIFPPGGAAPIRLYGVFSKAELLRALRQE